MGGRPLIGVCLKWVERRPEIDPLTGEVGTDARTSGGSEADQSALEWGLRLGEAWGGEVVAVTAGTADAEPVLRDALAAGADRAVRVDLPAGAASAAVAAGLAEALAGAAAVVCGDWSLDRGSGSVPAFLAARMGAAQALGLVAVELELPGSGATARGSGASGPARGDARDGRGGQVLRVERRLDGGRRERLTVTAPMVLSVEGRDRLRRADLDGLLRARTAPIERVAAPAAVAAVSTDVPPLRTGPYRPRPRVLPPPAGGSARERILALTGALVDRTPPELVTLDPASAADRLLAQLQSWGYLDR
ncbi:MAG TPA: mycofactocin-associated electron transfer flavoprotein beta subunit [Acidimicrobiales bacterium]|nr:mycofactocin-associated electron transfer flavoprotein beta subunit [Acidimicrobiales bacterium]